MPTAQQVNLARRLSVQNENDMVQSLFDFDDEEMPKKAYDRESCSQLARHLVHFKDMPAECIQYPDLAFDLKRRDSDTTHPSSLLS